MIASIKGKINIIIPQNNCMWAKLDSKGRLHIPKELRSKLDDKVFLIEIDDGILIIPKPKDPIKTLEEIGRLLPDKSIEEFRREIKEIAEEEI